MTDVPADWYDDPTTPGQLRYWDGSQWTDHVHQITAPQEDTPVVEETTVAQPDEQSLEPEADASEPAAGSTPPAGLSGPPAFRRDTPADVVTPATETPPPAADPAPPSVWAPASEPAPEPEPEPVSEPEAVVTPEPVDDAFAAMSTPASPPSDPPAPAGPPTESAAPAAMEAPPSSPLVPGASSPPVASPGRANAMPGLAALGAVVPLAAAIAFFTPVVKNGIAQSEVSSPLYIVLVMAPAVVGLIALRGTRAAAAAAAGCGLISLGVFVAVTELSRVSEGFIEVSTGYVFWTFSAGAAFILFLLVGATGPTPTDRLGDGTVMGTTLFGLVAVVGAGIPPDGSPDWWTWFTSDGQGWLTILNPLFVGGLLLATVLVAATRTRVAAAFAFGVFGSLSFGWAWAVGDFEEVAFSGLSFNSGAEIALGIGLVGAAAFAAFGALAEGPVDGPTNPAWAAVAIIAVVGLGLLAVVRDDESLEERCAGGDFDACDELFFSLPADGPVEVTTPPTR